MFNFKKNSETKKSVSFSHNGCHLTADEYIYLSSQLNNVPPYTHGKTRAVMSCLPNEMRMILNGMQSFSQ
jgi:hypothetical protein